MLWYANASRVVVYFSKKSYCSIYQKRYLDSYDLLYYIFILSPKLIGSAELDSPNGSHLTK